MLLYVVYEVLIQVRYPHFNIRADVLVLWPLLIGAFAKAWYRAHPADGARVSALALVSLAMGVVGILFATFLLFALAAVICGHVALRRLRSVPSPKGRDAARAGLAMGYVGLAMGIVSWLFAVVS